MENIRRGWPKSRKEEEVGGRGACTRIRARNRPISMAACERACGVIQIGENARPQDLEYSARRSHGCPATG